MLYIYRANAIEDFVPFYELKCQRDAIAWSGFESAPEKDRLYDYFVEHVVNNPKTYVFYLRDSDMPDEVCIGYEQFDLQDNGIVEMRGTVIKRSYQGLGYYDDLRNLIEQEIIKLGGTRIESWCSEKNIASIAGAIENGWKMTEDSRIVNLPKLGENMSFINGSRNCSE